MGAGTPPYLLGKLRPAPPIPAIRTETDERPASLSKHEARFKALWERCGGPPLAEQFIFSRARRWRLDFAHVESKTGIELHGGTFARAGNGRHTSGTGFQGDREKMNAAIRNGWVIVELTEKMIGYEAVALACEIIFSRCAVKIGRTHD